MVKTVDTITPLMAADGCDDHNKAIKDVVSRELMNGFKVESATTTASVVSTSIGDLLRITTIVFTPVS